MYSTLTVVVMGMFSPVVVFYVWVDLCSATRKPKCAVVRIMFVIACFVTLINKFLSVNQALE